MARTAANSTAVFVKYGGSPTRDRNATVAVIIYIDNDVRSCAPSIYYFSIDSEHP